MVNLCRRAASLLRGVPQQRVTDRGKDLAGSVPLSVSMSKTAGSKKPPEAGGRRRQRGRASRRARDREQPAAEPLSAKRSRVLLYATGSFVFVKVVGNELAVAKLLEHMWTVTGQVREGGIRSWVEPAVVEVEYYHEDPSPDEFRLGCTRMIPEVTDENAVDRGSIYGAVACDREKDAIYISQTEMSRMKEVVEAPPVEVELAPSQPWSAAAEPGSQRSQAAGASKLFDEIRAGNWENAGSMAHLRESKRAAWMAEDLPTRTGEHVC